MCESESQRHWNEGKDGKRTRPKYWCSYFCQPNFALSCVWEISSFVSNFLRILCDRFSHVGADLAGKVGCALFHAQHSLALNMRSSFNHRLRFVLAFCKKTLPRIQYIVSLEGHEACDTAFDDSEGPAFLLCPNCPPDICQIRYHTPIGRFVRLVSSPYAARRWARLWGTVMSKICHCRTLASWSKTPPAFS